VATKLELVNKALSLLGEGLLTSGQLTTPDDDTSRTVSAVYEMARKAVLRDCRPNCARQYAALVVALPAPVNVDFVEAFDLPADCLRALQVLAIVDGAEVVPGIGAPVVTRWRVMNGRHLLADETAVALEYVADIPETDFDPLTDEAMAYYLAWQLAVPLTESRATANDMRDQYLLAKDVAMGSDEQEGFIDRFDQASRLTGVRR
jgi:hypothetical protein